MSSEKCSFSVDFILNVAGSDIKKKLQEPNQGYDWLQCTRYRPPKLPRQKKREGVQRRNLGRNPRIPFSSAQIALLEAKFAETPYLSSSDVYQLAHFLELSETRVKIWFQNRRARERREKDMTTRRRTDEDDNGADLLLNRHSPSSSNHEESVELSEISASKFRNTNTTNSSEENSSPLSHLKSSSSHMILLPPYTPVLQFGFYCDPVVK